MSDTTDKIVGKVKETVGNVTGNEKLEAEGKVEQLIPDTKRNAEAAVDTVKDHLDNATDRRV